MGEFATILANIDSYRLKFNGSRVGELAQVNHQGEITLQVLSQHFCHSGLLCWVTASNEFDLAVVPSCQVAQGEPAGIFFPVVVRFKSSY
jgi:hypothetical protein